MQTPVVPVPKALERANPLRGLDRFDWLVLATLAAVSMWVVAFDLWYAGTSRLYWTGVDGEFPVDQMQYLAWVQDASRHLLASDLFGLRATPHDYLQPMLVVSGGLAAAGVAPWLALLVWKPVAVGAIFFACRTYCRRLFATRREQRAALVLVLFAALPRTLGDTWIPFQSWGYLYGLVALAAMVAALVAYAQAREDGARLWLAPALGLLASWLHPWQGEILILIVIAVELAGALGFPRLHSGRRPLLLVSTVLATALPLTYYAILEHTDPAWRLAETISRHHQWSLTAVLLPLLPLLLASALAYRRRPAGFLDAATRAWPPAALAVWMLTQAGLGATALHAFTGITIPLGVLSVQGVMSIRWGRVRFPVLVASIAVAAVTIPGSVDLLKAVPAYIGPATNNQNLISAGERRAFEYLAADPQPGSVLSSYTLGDAVPGETGRRSTTGDFRWSGPNYEAREGSAWRLLHGRLVGARARLLVLDSGARFVLGGCEQGVDLTSVLAPILSSVHRFGCATVYVIRRDSPGPPDRRPPSSTWAVT